VLTEREFALLHHLMREGGGVCSRERLLADVWGLSFETGSNVVDVYVGRLRSKLGEEIIETVRNVGYRLNVA
jgi:DNA-binding response OmpR family regulator